MIAVCSKTRAARFGADVLTVPIRSYSDRDDTSVRGECAGQQTSTASRSSRMQPIQQEFASLTLTSTISMSSRAKISAAPPRQRPLSIQNCIFSNSEIIFSGISILHRFPVSVYTDSCDAAVGFCQRAVDVADRACVSSHPPLLRHPICKEPRKEWATSVSAFGNARNSNVVGLSDR